MSFHNPSFNPRQAGPSLPGGIPPLLVCRETIIYALDILVDARNALQDGGIPAQMSAALLDDLAADASILKHHSHGILSHSKDPSAALAEGDKLLNALRNSQIHEARVIKYRNQTHTVLAHDAIACLLNAIRAIADASLMGLGLMVEVED